MHMQSNNDEKKYRFFDPFTGEAPLKKERFCRERLTFDFLLRSFRTFNFSLTFSTKFKVFKNLISKIFCLINKLLGNILVNICEAIRLKNENKKTKKVLARLLFDNCIVLRNLFHQILFVSIFLNYVMYLSDFLYPSSVVFGSYV